MNVFKWVAGCFSIRGKALSLYRRGMKKAKNRDHQGAIDDYTAAIEMIEIPVDVKAMALYNRALVFAAAGQQPRAADDLNFVLAMEEELVNVKSMAKQKLVRMESRSRKNRA